MNDNLILLGAIMLVAYLLHLYIKRQAYREGLNEGLIEGRRISNELSILVGRQQGYAAGFQDGRSEKIQKEENYALLDLGKRLEEVSGR